MPLISFSVFPDKIESGAKVQTIRSLRKYPIKEGDRLYLWWKSRSPKEKRKLGESVCVKITPVVINAGAIKVGTAIVDYPLSLEYFAQRDGFESWDEMKEYFRPKFGDPLEVIEWEYPFLIKPEILKETINMPETNSKPWRLSMGVHRGTMMSRDTHSVDYQWASPSKPLTSLDEVKETAGQWKRNYLSLGLQIWYMNAIAPDGTNVNL